MFLQVIYRGPHQEYTFLLPAAHSAHEIMVSRSPSYARSISRGRSVTRSPLSSKDRSPSRSTRRSFSPNDRRSYRSDSRSRSPRRSPNGAPPRARYRNRSLSRSRSTSRSPVVPRSSKVVVEKLTRNVNEGHLREIFGVYGAIEDLDMPMNRTCE